MRAVVKANQELLYFYWTLGKDIAEMHVEELWGKNGRILIVAHKGTFGHMLASMMKIPLSL
mgnify:CR=1 FL=1